MNKVKLGVATNIGKKRRGVNQDATGYLLPTWYRNKPPLFVLADGMGGYGGGEVASRLVVQGFLDAYLAAHARALWQTGEPGAQACLTEAVKKAHRLICNRSARASEHLGGMGSTVVALLVGNSHAQLVNVGDSRAYLIRDSKLSQVSEDQSYVAELVRAGEVDPKEASRHPQRNRLTMSISARHNQVTPVYHTIELQSGDQFLLCSDGLWSVVPEDEILYYILNFPAQQAAEDLVAQANEYGGPDNISVMVVQTADVPENHKRTLCFDIHIMRTRAQNGKSHRKTL